MANLTSLACLCHLQLLRSQMAKAAESGLNVMRTWAQAVDSIYPLQPSPGEYVEEIFVGLDYALDQARQHKIKVASLESDECVLGSALDWN